MEKKHAERKDRSNDANGKADIPGTKSSNARILNIQKPLKGNREFADQTQELDDDVHRYLEAVE